MQTCLSPSLNNGAMSGLRSSLLSAPVLPPCLVPSILEIRNRIWEWICFINRDNALCANDSDKPTLRICLQIMLDRLQFPEWALPTSELSKKIAVLAIVLPFVLEFISYVTCEWRRKTRLVDLPVLNLENGNYKAAEQSYITDMKKRLQIGREKVGLLASGQ